MEQILLNGQDPHTPPPPLQSFIKDDHCHTHTVVHQAAVDRVTRVIRDAPSLIGGHEVTFHF